MGESGGGNLIAIGLGGAALVVAVVVGGFVAFGRRPDPAPAVRPISTNMQLAAEGARAPGTSELRRLGCDQALVVDMARLLGGAQNVREGEPRFMVTCDVGPTAAMPSCEKVQSTYYGAIGGVPEGNVGVRVSRSGAAAPSCSRLFAPSGADLGAFAPH